MFGFVSPSTRMHTRGVPTVVHIFEIVSRLFWTLAPDLLCIAFVFRDLFTHFFRVFYCRGRIAPWPLPRQVFCNLCCGNSLQ
jgi:hypothetical protein